VHVLLPLLLLLPLLPLLLPLQVSFDESSTLEELSTLADETDAKARWAALKPEERLAHGRQAAMGSVRAQQAKAESDKEERLKKREEADARYKEERGKKRAAWEEDWTSADEEEVVERLNRLPEQLTGMKKGDGEHLEKLVARIRANPALLAHYESQARASNQFQDMRADLPEGEMPTEEMLRNAGIRGGFERHDRKTNKMMPASMAEVADVMAKAGKGNVVGW
jgi:hypothetical protein